MYVLYSADVVSIFIKTVPPTVSTEPASGEVIVRRSTSVSLECKANGNPPPSVTWVKMRSNRREDEVVDPRRRFQPSQLSNNGLVLTLSDVTRHDAGRYRCTASNDVGRDAEGFIHLRVLCKYIKRSAGRRTVLLTSTRITLIAFFV